MSETPQTAYLASEGRVAELRRELGTDPVEEIGSLLLAQAPERPSVWALNVWRNPVVRKISSIGDAVKILRALQRNWAHFPHREHRRSQLIQDQLPKLRVHPLKFPEPAPAEELGSWTLLDRDTMLYSASCTSRFPNGMIEYEEPEGLAPPSSAYLKLWDALTLFGRQPQAGEKCLDLGACPGGWTWALQRLGSEVVSVDKAPLDPKIEALPGVTWMKKDAFRLKPEDLGALDWLFSDVICYPEKLLELVTIWCAARPELKMVCTIKFQGETDEKSLLAFAKIPGSRVVHVPHNKHEVMWMRAGAGDRP